MDGRAGLISVLAAVTMFFAALTSAYVVRRGLSTDWASLRLPPVVYASALPLMAAGVAQRFHRGLAILSCVLFAAVQIYAWEQMDSSTAATAFFRVLSIAFTVCVLGGAFGAFHRKEQGYYWLYLNALWAYLLVLLSVWS